MEEMNSYTQFKRITTAGAIISGVAVFVLMLFIVLDVVLRNMGGASIPGGFEIVENSRRSRGCAGPGSCRTWICCCHGCRPRHGGGRCRRSWSWRSW